MIDVDFPLKNLIGCDELSLKSHKRTPANFLMCNVTGDPFSKFTSELQSRTLEQYNCQTRTDIHSKITYISCSIIFTPFVHKWSLAPFTSTNFESSIAYSTWIPRILVSL